MNQLVTAALETEQYSVISGQSELSTANARSGQVRAISARIEYDLYKRLKHYCAEHDLKLNDIMVTALKSFLKNHG